MTWRLDPAGYELFFNRDESHLRKPALPPSVRERDGLRFIAPADGDFGGTWIAVNAAGLSCCLLNAFAAASGPAGARAGIRSRGEIPLDLVASRDPAAAARVLRELPLDEFRPFVAVVVGAAGEGMVGSWSGLDLDVSMELPGDQPLVSSSFCTEEVRRNRVAVYRRMREAGGDDSAMHLAYHRRHEPEAGPYSPCMHRPDAATVSFSRVEVGSREVRFHYVAQSPCRAGPGPPLRLERD